MRTLSHFLAEFFCLTRTRHPTILGFVRCAILWIPVLSVMMAILHVEMGPLIGAAFRFRRFRGEPLRQALRRIIDDVIMLTIIFSAIFFLALVVVVTVHLLFPQSIVDLLLGPREE